MARVSYPVSNYFTLGRIDEDQAQDYAKRKGWDEREMMKWLGVSMKWSIWNIFLTISKINIDLV